MSFKDKSLSALIQEEAAKEPNLPVTELPARLLLGESDTCVLGKLIKIYERATVEELAEALRRIEKREKQMHRVLPPKPRALDDTILG